MLCLLTSQFEVLYGVQEYVPCQHLARVVHLAVQTDVELADVIHRDVHAGDS